jgi:hypothetical protein
MMWLIVVLVIIIMNMEWHDVYGKETDHEYMMLNIVAVVRIIMITGWQDIGGVIEIIVWYDAQIKQLYRYIPLDEPLAVSNYRS